MAYNPSVEIFDSTFDKVQKAMEVATKRQAVIAHNVANADTPGFQALKFDEVLQKAVARTEQPSINLEEEMAALTQNSTRYSSYVKLMSSKLNILKTIASQGRK
ncbi:MAG: flagellar basal body protein [Candidatus Margulisbacteria bacterium]|nr:flagellar basal body protein [Candidatus Margulisiibacteriota bacterium]MBU1021488.1 flagellar basal body protein [Candidatus Margulisiibacteriota bacterium]MBU1728573.1 flagellar basal body protein [Candidatus Margulisiibacteriota bacterium]MBU1955848.1 flagellar basal body protein [Candidatus Margulisiibacteriota bacterium]